MATYTKIKLSRNSAVGNAPFNTGNGAFAWYDVHETSSSTTVLDEIWLWITNRDSSVTATIELRCFDTTAGFGDTFYKADIPPKTTILVLGGYPISAGDSTGAIKIQVWDGSGAGDTWAYGFVNRITP